MNDGVIDTALERGIIDEEQAARLKALAVELAAPTQALADERVRARPREARRGFNAVTVAYAAGALLVLFALGWFLVDRWMELGTVGVLVTSVAYALAFAGIAVALRRRGFRVAGGLLATLAVCMTPVWTYALMRLAGEWPPPEIWNDPQSAYRPWKATRWMILELSTIGVALATMRRVRFSVLGAPLAAAFIAFLIHLGQSLGDPRTAWYTGPYYIAVCACLVLAIAYLVDRQQPIDEDYTVWFYVGGQILLLYAYLALWGDLGRWRHALPLTGAAFLMAALYLRRRTLLVGAGLAAFGYLAYLAFDVFEEVVALPVALAGLGLVVIVATVWVQRRFPSLVERVGRDEPPGTKELPGHLISAFGPVVIALTALFFASREAEDRTVDREFREILYRRRALNRPEPPVRRPGQPSAGVDRPERPEPAAPR
jgi:hypothetical protein